MNNPEGIDELMIARHKKLFFGEKEKVESRLLAEINRMERLFGVQLLNIHTVTDEATGECKTFTLSFKL